ncbi:MAG: choice-of-anchor J domain-containing protein [Paludibacteraceae bacterium]|nr:choice-of-anchor J domain-containing protein [Paludibacteraceae bacterium]
MKKIFSYLLLTALCFSGLQLNAETLNEGFEAETFAPEGWTALHVSGYYSWDRSTAVHNTGSACAYMKFAAGSDNYLITPQLRPEANETLKFWTRTNEYSKGTVFTIEVSTGDAIAADFTDILATYTTSSADADRIRLDWMEKEIDLSAYKGQRIYVAFHIVDDGGSTVYLDDVSGITLAGNLLCDAPTDLKLTEINATSATIEWQGEESTQYQVVYTQQSNQPDWNAAQQVNALSVTLSNLSPATAYDVYVRTFCSESEQSSAQHFALLTPCEAVSTLPWTCDFEGTNKLALPDCWNIISNDGNLYVLVDSNEPDEETGLVYKYAHSGDCYLKFYGGGPATPQIAVLPAFGENIKSEKIYFWYNTGFQSENCPLPEFGYVTNPTDAYSFVTLLTLEQQVSYTQVEYSLDKVPAGAFIAFRYAGGVSNFGSLAIDDIQIGELPTAIEKVVTPANTVKRIENGQLVIIRNGVKYNALGQEL